MSLSVTSLSRQNTRPKKGKKKKKKTQKRKKSGTNSNCIRVSYKHHLDPKNSENKKKDSNFNQKKKKQQLGKVGFGGVHMIEG